MSAYAFLRNHAGTHALQICFEKLWFEVHAIAGHALLSGVQLIKICWAIIITPFRMHEGM